HFFNGSRHTFCFLFYFLEGFSELFAIFSFLTRELILFRNRLNCCRYSMLHLLNELANFINRMTTAICKRLDFLCNDNEASPLFSCTCCFNRCIQCKQVSLLSDTANDTRYISYLFSKLTKLLNRFQ